MRRPLANFLISMFSIGLLGFADPYLLRLRLPVAWQVTSSRSLGNNSATVTESFREVWTLEVGSSGLINLTSPRASVPVYSESSAPMQSSALTWVGIKQGDLARLLGIAITADGEFDDAASVRTSDRLVFIQIGRADRQYGGIGLNWSFDQHYVVSIDIGPHVAL
jgi:hypothetical protein